MEQSKDAIWKHVRIGKALYDKPKDLWNDAIKYFEWADNNPVKCSVSTSKTKRSRKNSTEENIQASTETTTRPYTFFGLAAFLGIPDWYKFKMRYFAKEGFEEVILTIENVIASQQVDNAMVGVFKEGLTARLNGIAENIKTDNYLDIDGSGQQFNGFKFLPHTDGLENSESTKLASGEVPMLEPDYTEEPEPMYAEIIDEDGRARQDQEATR